MSDVFVSYAHEDKPLVRELLHALEEGGLSVFWDGDIRSGQRFDDAIEHELAQAGCVLVCWSRHSVESHWVRAEAQEGLDKRALVALTLDDARIGLPFRTVNTVDLSAWPDDACGPELDYLMASVRRVLASREDGAVHVDQALPIRHANTLSQRVAQRVVQELAPTNDTPLRRQLELEQRITDTLLRLPRLEGTELRLRFLLNTLCSWQQGLVCGFWRKGDLFASAPESETASLLTSLSVDILLQEPGFSLAKADEPGWACLATEQWQWAARIDSRREPDNALLLMGRQPLELEDPGRLARYADVLELLASL